MIRLLPLRGSWCGPAPRWCGGSGVAVRWRYLGPLGGHGCAFCWGYWGHGCAFYWGYWGHGCAARAMRLQGGSPWGAGYGRLEAMKESATEQTDNAVVLQTMGCRLNHAEAAAIRGVLESAGTAVLPTVHPAAGCGYVLHTCAVTAAAQTEALRHLRSARRAGARPRLLRIPRPGLRPGLAPSVARPFPTGPASLGSGGDPGGSSALAYFSSIFFKY